MARIPVTFTTRQRFERLHAVAQEHTADLLREKDVLFL